MACRQETSTQRNCASGGYDKVQVLVGRSSAIVGADTLVEMNLGGQKKGTSTQYWLEWGPGIVVYEKGRFGAHDDRTTFNDQFKKGVIVRRECPGCSSTHKNFFYRRLTNVPSSLEGGKLFLTDWVSSDNAMDKDFALYSTMQDAVRFRSSIRPCNFKSHVSAALFCRTFLSLLSNDFSRTHGALARRPWKMIES